LKNYVPGGYWPTLKYPNMTNFTQSGNATCGRVTNDRKQLFTGGGNIKFRKRSQKFITSKAKWLPG